jgi:hypothetical protein
MRRLSSFIKKYGPVVGPEYLRLLQRKSSASRWATWRLQEFKKKHGL